MTITPQTGCASIVDQLIEIRAKEQHLISKFEAGGCPSSIPLRLLVAELNHSLEMLDRALDAYGEGHTTAYADRAPVRMAAMAHG